MIRDYSEDDVDAELRALGIYTGNVKLHTKRKIITDHYDLKRRGGKPLPQIKPASRYLGSINKPIDELIHDISIESGLPLTMSLLYRAGLY